jgi:glutaredoxin/glutathione-dependent peroxiredoxin
MEKDLTANGMGIRSMRYAMVLKDGVVTYLGVDPGPADKSTAETILANL